MLELLIVALASLTIGAGIGACLSVPVSNKLLANEIANATSKYDDIGKNFGMGNFKPQDKPDSTEKTTEETTENKEETTETIDSKKDKSTDMRQFNFGIAKVSEVNSIDAVVDFKVLAELLGIGILLTLLSSLASMIAIARFSPLQILKERG